MKKLIGVLLVLALIAGLVVGCAGIPEEGALVQEGVEESMTGTIHYYYDEVHDVSIWVWVFQGEGSIAVLLGEDISNPLEPMEEDIMH